MRHWERDLADHLVLLMTKEALSEGPVAHNLSVVSDGAQALAYLRREGTYADAARPDLVLLDLNLPRKDGRDVLAEVKADAHLRVIPIVVLTTSESFEDIMISYRLHANAFVTKPADYNRYVETVRRISEFYGGIAKLPRQRNG